MAKKKKRGKKRATTSNKRSLAAKKGWKTRRAKKSKPVRKPRRRTNKERDKVLWRITIASPYYIRARGKRKRKTTSPESAAFIVRAWYARKLDAIADRYELKEKAEDGRARVVSENKRAFSKDEKPDIEIKAVRYDERLIGIVEETDEP